MLKRAVSSVFRQSFQDFELIIIDDGSPESCCDQFPKDPRIRIIRNRSSLGVARSRNVGIEAASGIYISFLDDDDEYLSSFLSRTYARLTDTPEEIGISWCGIVNINYSSETNRPQKLRVRQFGDCEDRETLLKEFFSIGTGNGVTVKASCLRKVGPFNSVLKVSSDTDMFFRILEQGFSPIAVPGVHVIRHHHKGSRLTGAVLNPERIRTWEEWIFVEHSEFLERYPSLRKGLVGYVDSLKPKPTKRTLYNSVKNRLRQLTRSAQA